MPELPEAEYMVRRLAEAVPPRARIKAAQVLRAKTVEPHRPAELEDALASRRIKSYSRRAKNVLIHLDRHQTLRIQLGMTGHIYWIPDHRHAPRFTRVMLQLSDGGGIAFEDARVFGSMNLHESSALPEVFTGYGPEPLDPAFTWQQLRASAAGSRAEIKPLLLDQSRVVGLGNIWAAESCFRARLSPFRRVHQITDPEWKRLHSAIRFTLSRAIAGTFKATRAADEFPEADLLACAVYGREGEPCRKCRQAVIERRTQSARSTFYCQRCQHPL
jgi:formamidopyrimidine-DNA glycosylase